MIWRPPGPRPALARAELRWLAALMLLGAVLRFSTLALQSYWLDEGVTVRLVRSSFRALLHGIRQSESAPPLFYVLGWGWSRLFGTGEVGLRSLSALIGTLVIPVTFAAGRRLGGTRVGLVAAALTATSPYLVWYSQEARAYALLVLLGAASVALLLRALDRPGTVEPAAWAAVSALAVWTHYFALFLVAAEAAVLIAATRSRAAAIAAAGVGVALLPLAPLFVAQTRLDHTSWIAEIPLDDRIRQTVRVFALGGHDSAVSTGRTALTVLAVALLAAGLVLLATCAPAARRRAAVVGAVAAAATVAPLLAGVVGRDYVFHRNLIAAWVPIALVAAVGLGATRARRTGIAVAAAACALGVTCTALVPADPMLQRPDWRGIARELGPGAPRAIVVGPGYDPTPQLYLPRLRPFPPTAPVTEIDAVVFGGAARLQVPAGFVPAGRFRTGWLTLLRYRARRPVVVRRSEVDGPLQPDAASYVYLDG